jgi:hypothetical protein
MITEARGSSVAPEAHQPSAMDEALLRIREMDTIDDQLAALLTTFSPYGRDKIPPITTFADVQSLVGFASDPESSSSLLVRVQAAERGLKALFHPDASEELAAHQQDLTPAISPRFLPHLAEHFQQVMSQSIFEGNQENQQYNRQRALIARLLTVDGFQSDRAMYPDWHEFSYQPTEMPNCQPVMAPLVLGELHADNAPAAGILRQLLPLAEELRAVYPEGADQLDHKLIQEYAALGGLHRYMNEGIEYRDLAAEVLELVGPQQAKELMRQFSEIRYYSPKLASSFPKDFQEGVLLGMNELLASSLYALQDHYANGGRTDVRLPLNDQPDVLPLYLKGNEPLQLLDKLIACIAQTEFGTKSTLLVAKTKEYELYRAINETTGRQYAMYVRPNGGYAYDQDYEYGNPRKGVEASISLVFDPLLPRGELLEVGRHRKPGPDNRLSIRIDREGIAPDQRGNRDIRQDTRQEQGTASLDVGSVLGNASDWGVKLARFLARGNQLRAEAQGQKTTLNHVTNHFSARHGQASFFSKAAREVRDEYRRTSWAGLSAIVRVVGRHTLANPGRTRLD